MDKIIEVKVSGSYLSKDNDYAGVQYEANAKTLRIEFDEGWDGYSKTVTFWNALGENPVKRVLTADLLEDLAHNTRIYLCPIPGEAMTEAGKNSFVIDGYVDGKRHRSVETTLKVTPAEYAEDAAEPTDPTPSQAEQLQVQIDTILQDMSAEADRAETAAEGAEAARVAAETARGAAEAAKNRVEAAVSEALVAETKAEEAQRGAEAARDIAVGAQNAAEAAQGKAETAKASAEKAAADAATSAAGVQGVVDAAEASASSAKASANEAAASKMAAATSASNAALSATAAANAAGAAAEQAVKAVDTTLSGKVAAAEYAMNRAETAAGKATQSETAATNSATVASTSATAAAKSATAAAQSASSATSAKEGAEKAAETAAEDAAVRAAGSVEVKLQEHVAAAEAAQRAAEQARDDAQSIAGGDFASTAYVDGKVATAESNANKYTDQKISSIPTPDVSGQIGAHNAAADAHADIRKSIGDHVADESNPHGVTAAQVGADPRGSASAALGEAKAYTDQKIAAIPTPDVSGQINVHNTATDAHSDIRAAVSNAASAASTAQSTADNHIANKSNPHGVTAAQVGADASGTAASAVGTHNTSTSAHGDIRTALNGKAPAGYGLGSIAKDISNTDLLTTLQSAASGFYMGINVTNAPDTNWWFFIVTSHNARWSTVLALSFTGHNHEMYIGQSNDGGENGSLHWTGWKKFASTEYAVNKAGDTMTGQLIVPSVLMSQVEGVFSLNGGELYDAWVQAGADEIRFRVFNKTTQQVVATMAFRNDGTLFLNGNTALHTGNKDQIFTYGTTDLTAGSSPLATGQLHFVYE